MTYLNTELAPDPAFTGVPDPSQSAVGLVTLGVEGGSTLHSLVLRCSYAVDGTVKINELTNKIIIIICVQELCESLGGRPRLPVLMSLAVWLWT